MLKWSVTSVWWKRNTTDRKDKVSVYGLKTEVSKVNSRVFMHLVALAVKQCSVMDQNKAGLTITRLCVTSQTLVRSGGILFKQAYEPRRHRGLSAKLHQSLSRYLWRTAVETGFSGLACQLTAVKHEKVLFGRHPTTEGILCCLFRLHNNPFHERKWIFQESLFYIYVSIHIFF